MDLFGRRNLHDINAQLIVPLASDRVSLLLWYHYFLLDRRTTPYGLTMQPFNTVAAAEHRELGHELDVLLDITLATRHSMLVGYSYFAPGRYYQRTPGVPTNRDAHFTYVQYQTRF